MTSHDILTQQDKKQFEYEQLKLFEKKVSREFRDTVKHHDEFGAEHMREFDDKMQNLAKMHYKTDEIIEESLR